MSHQHQSLTKLPPSLCPDHNLPFQTFCSAEGCQRQIRVCPKCKSRHSHHSQKFFTPASQVVGDLTTGLKRCFDKIDEYDARTKELNKLIKEAQVHCKEDYQEMERNLIELIKQDKKILQTKVLKMEQIRAKIQTSQRIKNYFTRLHSSSLLNLKIKLSNEKGMLQLKQRNEKLCELISKSSFQQVQKLYSQFKSLREDIEGELQNNLTFKLGQVIAMKNARKMKGDKPVKEKENKEPIEGRSEKKKPKTMTNFGEGLINGILNFLNL